MLDILKSYKHIFFYPLKNITKIYLFLIQTLYAYLWKPTILKIYRMLFFLLMDRSILSLINYTQTYVTEKKTATL